MKKINILYLVFFFAAMLGCEDEYEAPNSFSDVSWYSVVHDRLDGYPIIGQSSYYTISDLSQGELSHKWELLDSAIYFLEGPIVKGDTLLEEKIIGGGYVGDFSTDKTAHFYFPEGGIQSVRLYNTYKDSVTFIAEDTVFSSVYDEATGMHIFDHTFTVDVYFDIVPEYSVYRPDLTKIDFDASPDTIVETIEAGQSMHFVQEIDSMYHHTDVTWNIPGGAPRTSYEDSTKVTFYAPGIYSGMVFTASRNAQNTPSSTAKDTIPLKLIVEPSKEDFKAVSVSKVNSKAVKVQLTGQAKGALAKTDFKVIARNADKGADFPIPVASVEMIQENTSVQVNFEEPIYSNDEVIVEYTGSTMMSTDSRKIIPSTVTLAPIPPVNLVADPGFEDGADTWQTPPTYSSDRAPSGVMEYSTDQANGGSYSMHAVKSVDDVCTAFGFSNSFVLEAGVTYDYTFDYYIENDGGSVWESRISAANDNGTVEDSKLYGGWFNPSKVGVWTKKSAQITGDGGTYTIAFLIYKPGTSIDAYFDNFNISVNDSRP